MAIVFDTATDGGYASSATSLTFSHTCSGSNRILFVSVVVNTSDVITGATYIRGGVATQMTLVEKYKYSTARYIYLFYMTNPDSGANNVVVSASSAPDLIIGVSASYKNANQFALDSHSHNGNASGNLTVSTTTVANNCWTVACAVVSGGTATAGTGSTFRVKNATFLTPSFFDSNAAITPAGSTNMVIAHTGGATGAIIASFAPTVSSATTGVNAYLDENSVPTMTGASNLNGTSVTRVYATSNNGLSINDSFTGNDFGPTNALKDQNNRPILQAVSSVDGSTPVSLYVDSSNSLLINSN